MGDAYIRDTIGVVNEACGRLEAKPRPVPPPDKTALDIIPLPYTWFEDPEKIFPRCPVTGEKYDLTRFIKAQNKKHPYNWFNVSRGVIRQVYEDDFDDLGVF